MKTRYLRVIETKTSKEKSIQNITYSERIKDFFECIFVSENKKIYFIKDSLIRLYKDYEDTTGVIDVPYFVKAERRISQIIKSGKINY